RGAWHRAVGWRRVWPWGRVAQRSFRFRTADPMQVYVAWLAAPTTVRADIGATRPLAPAPTVEAAIRQAGAGVQAGEGVETARWASVRPGQRLTLTLPAGLGGEGG